MGEYPPVGFHFLVTFHLLPQTPEDFRFQEVSGLSVELEMESYVEGGENRFTHQLPVRTRYQDITLKRGLAPLTSGLFLWTQGSLECFNFQPVNLNITLLNDRHAPTSSWFVANAIPKRWEISTFNAEQSSVVIETLTLSYQYYRSVREPF